MERQQKKDWIREKIIESSLGLLKDRTWESVSSQEICTAAKVSKRTLYAYFRSQDEIYLELVRRCFLELTQDMGTAFSKGDTIIDQFINVGAAYLMYLVNEPVKGSLVVRFDEMRFIQNYPEQVKAISNSANQYELLSLFRQLDLDPEIYDRVLALYLWSHIQGMAQLLISKSMWLEDYYGASMARLIEEQITFIRKVLEGIKK
jgi:AcrR family transcriptional regulator